MRYGRRRRALTVLLAFAAVLAACGEQVAPDGQPGGSGDLAATTRTANPTDVSHPSPNPTGNAYPEAGTHEMARMSWLLTSLNGERPPEGSVVTLGFGARHNLYGFDGCQAYSGAYTIKGDGATVVRVEGTDLPCAGTGMTEHERTLYLRALRGATRLQRPGDSLEIGDPATGSRLVFVPQRWTRAAPDLRETSWTLVSLNGRRVGDADIGLRFGPAELEGGSGCNGYGGSYAAVEGVLHRGGIWSTAMACQSSRVMDREATYLDVFRRVATYRIIGGRLYLRDAAGETLLVFRREGPAVRGTATATIHVSRCSPFLRRVRDSTAGRAAARRAYTRTRVPSFAPTPGATIPLTTTALPTRTPAMLQS